MAELTGGEWVVVAYLRDGENGERGGSLHRLVIFIGGGEREGWSWSRTLAIAGRRHAGAVGSWNALGPLSRVADRWALVGVFKTGASQNRHPSHNVHSQTC
jgi:hypothetical protein